MKLIAKALGKVKVGKGKQTYAALPLCAATAVALSAQTFTTLHTFDVADGAQPIAGLALGTDGNLYGTTLLGGTDGAGTVFKITPGGALTTLYDFCALVNINSTCTDGAGSYARLVQATDGNFYGTTWDGGANACPPYNGCGTVFKITPSGTLTALYPFCSQSGCTDGAQPVAGIIQAADGNFYGTTSDGGANDCSETVLSQPGCGTVFKMTPSGTLTTLYSFCSQVVGGICADGVEPNGLIQATDGNFYGTTQFGGDVASCYLHDGGGCGTVFKITPNGTLTTLYSFCSQIAPHGACTDGAAPSAGLVQATDGNFYGTTVGGGANGGYGTVFKITPSGTLTTLYSFCSQIAPDGECADGEYPYAALVQATDGDFYGTTWQAGANTSSSVVFQGGGTIFKITPGGTLTTLYSFCSQSSCTDGAGPYAGLVQATNGAFYGTAEFGGASDACNTYVNYPPGCGTVFSLSLGLGPSLPAVNVGGVLNSGSYTAQGVAPGSIVSIFGTNLAASTAVASAIPLPTELSDVTSVTLNGIPAGLYFVSTNQINAQLPFDVLPGQDSGTASIVVTRGSGASAPQNVTVAPASPGIFTTSANGSGQAFAYDNTTGAVAAPAGASIGSLASAPISISSGDALIIACTGLGSVNPSIGDYVAASDGMLRYTVLTPTVLIGGVAATPIYSVLSPQFVSEYQVGVVPAPSTPTGDAVSLQIQIGGMTTSNQVTIAVAP